MTGLHAHHHGDEPTTAFVAELNGRRDLIETLSEDGTTFVPLSSQISSIPPDLSDGVWKAAMPTLDGEQWLFHLSAGIYALTTDGRVIRDLDATMYLPQGYGMISLRASGCSSTPRDNRPRRPNKGPCMRLLPPGEQTIRQFIANEYRWQSVGFLIAQHLWEAFGLSAAREERLTEGDGEADGPIALPMEILQQICDTSTICVRNSQDLLRARSLLLGLLARVLPELTCQVATGPSAAVSPVSMRHVIAARDAVVRTLAAPPSQRRLARLVGTNERKLVEGFKNLYGVSPAKFTRNSRMEWARSLLLSGEVSVTQLAATVGFADVATFSRAFRAHFGTSPRQMRQAAMAGEQVRNGPMS